MNIAPNVLNHYIQRSNISFDELKNSIPNIESFLNGEKKPTFNQLLDISKKLNIPTGLLVLDKEIDISNSRLEFRTLGSSEMTKMSDELRDTIAEMQEKQDFLHQEIDDELDFIGNFSINDNVLYVADAIRKKLDLPVFFQPQTKTNVLNYLRNKISDIGVFIFFNGKIKSNTHRRLSPNEFRGFVLSDKKAPIIFINQKDTKNGQVFTLIHELVHLFIGNEEIFNFIETRDYKFSPLETFVNKVTAEILVPESEFTVSNPSIDNIEPLAKKFKVSEFVIIRRLFSLNYISKTKYQKEINKLQEKYIQQSEYKSVKSGGDYYQTLKFMNDKKFIYYLREALNSHKISYTDVCNIIGVKLKSFKKLTSEI